MSTSIVRAPQHVGITVRDITNSLVVNLAGSSQVAPTFWLNPENGVPYPIVMQTPQYQPRYACRARRLCRSGGRDDHAAGAGGRRQLHARQHATRWSRNTTSSRWCRSMPRRKDVISARVAADVQQLLDDTRN